MFERLEGLIENIEIFKNKKIVIIGLGGVGSYALETLVRSGFENITIVDSDTIDLSNLNRQLMSLQNNIDQKKVDVFEKRISLINPNCQIIKIDKFITKDNLDLLFQGCIHYVIDACDTIETKKELIKYCQKNKIKIISSMGMGNRLDNTKVKITTLDKTNYDPVAKKLRLLLRKEELSLKIPVVWSEEKPIIKTPISSIAHVPALAGLLCTNYVINDIVNEVKNETRIDKNN